MKRLLKRVGLFFSLRVSSLHLLTYALAPGWAVIDATFEVWMREHELHGSTLLGLEVAMIGVLPIVHGLGRPPQLDDRGLPRRRLK